MIFFKNKEIINESGFTLLEALVTIGIMAIMSAVYLTSYRTNNQKIILDQAAAGVMADLRLAQNMAMNVTKFNGEIPKGGYGINITVSSPGIYAIYADCDEDHLYGNSSSCGSAGDMAEKISDRSLADGINVSAVGNSDIVFQPPQPIVWIGGNTAASSTITLRYGSAGGPTKIITINGYTGQISAN